MEDQGERETKPTKSTLYLFNSIDLIPSVQFYTQVDKKSKEMSKPYVSKISIPKSPMAKPVSSKSTSHNVKLSKLIIETYKIHSLWLDTQFYHLTNKPSLEEFFDLEPNLLFDEYAHSEFNPILTHERV